MGVGPSENNVHVQAESNFQIHKQFSRMFPMESPSFLLSAVFTRQQEHLRVELIFSLRVNRCNARAATYTSSHLHPARADFTALGKHRQMLLWKMPGFIVQKLECPHN